MKHSLVFVATTPFAVNAFLRPHLLALAEIYEVTLCVNTTAYPLVDDVVKAVRVRHIDIARKISPWQDLRALHQLLRCFREIRPVVVHSLTPKAGLLAMFVAWVLDVPERFHTFTGQVWANRVGVARSLLKGIDRITAGCATRVFADSKSQCLFLELEGVVPRGRIDTLGPGSVAGVDIFRFRPDLGAAEETRKQMGLHANELVFLFVGRLTREKGLFDLIEAFASLQTKHPDWELWVVGPDEENLQQPLRAIGEKLGMKLRFFGPTNTPESFMKAADVLVLPSYREGFGSVIIEAGACGVPAIAYRVVGVVDAIEDGETGYCIEAGDVIGLANVMLRLGESPTELNRLGRSARIRVENHFSSERIRYEWVSLYKSIDK